MTDGTIIDDYRSPGEENLSIKDITLQHIKEIGKIMRDDWHGGYWQDLAIGTAGGTMIIKKYIPDNREAYANAIKYLYDILHPQFDTKMNKNAKEYEQLLEAHQLKALGEENEKEEQMMLIEIHRKLFRDLQSFLYRENYMNAGGITE